MSLSTSSAAPSTTSRLSEPSPKSDHRILVVVVILSIVGVFLIGFTIWMTLRLKRRQDSGETVGPYQGVLIHNDHPATHITPFAPPGPHIGRTAPQYKHNPGEDMRIAFRRPDGAWHFADSRTPFTPAGVNELDVIPSPVSSATSLISFNSRFPPTPSSPSTRGHNPRVVQSPAFPPSVYHREPCSDHFDDHQPPEARR